MEQSEPRSVCLPARQAPAATSTFVCSTQESSQITRFIATTGQNDATVCPTSEKCHNFTLFSQKTSEFWGQVQGGQICSQYNCQNRTFLSWQVVPVRKFEKKVQKGIIDLYSVVCVFLLVWMVLILVKEENGLFLSLICFL